MQNPKENTDSNAENAAPPEEAAWKQWLKRMGIGGFLFFLIKGILWLLLPYLGLKGLWSH
ncbi:MAG: hypothetical protein RI894_1446 [Bacteroidota bacterium]|jgi:hypothetical protein